MTASVRSATLPPFSALHRRVRQGDFLDCYAVASDMAPRQAAEVITDFPGWARMLVQLRRALTAPFGLDNEGPQVPDKVGIFPVEAMTDSELIAGFDDKHLDFRVSVTASDGRVALATWAHPHNFGGRAYLALIYPFHVLIVRNALARVAHRQPLVKPPQTP
ncbi:DUF2867 domain-containing protein [Aestuariivita sp.]|uniref:DUF2867 domain-containing protein n=1 Tax=Aestuariivita sp. TaxID=1872407 RepID=UPI00216D7805|nr:DUF2867 domain-containing protein [Aestuariivita sp.]MCE8008093.1 DUF2867 domain-containing protein [Aestuariivita sp.]